MSSILLKGKLDNEYIITRNINKTDFYDIFELHSKVLKQPPELSIMMISFFNSFPYSFRILLSIRETISKYLGLKIAKKTTKKQRQNISKNFKGNIGDKIAIFEVLEKSDIELMTGQKDKHLDFKLSFITYKKNNSIVLKLITTVNIHNRLGRIYFSLVKPIHQFYMHRIIKRMEQKIIEESNL